MTYQLTGRYPYRPNNKNILTFILRLKHAMQTQRRRSLHIGKTHDQILRHVAEAFRPARQGTILNSHRVIGIAVKLPILQCC